MNRDLLSTYVNTELLQRQYAAELDWMKDNADREAGIVKQHTLEDAINQPRDAPSETEFNLRVPNAIAGEPDEQFVLNGRLLGFGTSQSDRHRGHPGDDYMPAGGGRCSACRWFEVRIIKASDVEDVGGSYVIHTFGGSAVPGEDPRCRAHVTSSPFEVIAFLTVRHNGYTYIPHASMLALSQAAHWDTDIRQACFNRETGVITQLRLGRGHAA